MYVSSCRSLIPFDPKSTPEILDTTKASDHPTLTSITPSLPLEPAVISAPRTAVGLLLVLRLTRYKKQNQY